MAELRGLEAELRGAREDEGEVVTPRFRMPPQSANGAALSDKQEVGADEGCAAGVK